MPALGCIADDYTGAADLAGVLTSAGLRTVLAVGVPPEDLPLGTVDAIVVALKSRSVAPARAVELSLAALAWLRGRSTGHILFKICSTFDSTDRGNIGPVLHALRRALGAGAVPVNPSFIETGRTVYRGHLFVHDALLSDSPLKDHPLNPMRDANLVRVLGRQTAEPVSLLALPVVEDGPEAIAAALDRASGPVIVDGVAPRHLDALGEAALSRPLSCGASGLGRGLARAILARDGAATAEPMQVERAPGSRAAILAGSCSSATLRQIERMNDRAACRQLDVEALLGGDDEAEAVTAWARDRLADGPVLISSSAAPDALRDIQARHGGERVGQAVEAALASIANALVEHGVSRLVIAGGETSGAVVDRLGLQAFLVGKEIAPGVPALTAFGAHHAGVALALKSGNFGGDDFLERALEALS